MAAEQTDGDRPTVSVCMPAHRDHPWFRAALASALAQEGVDLEVVVSDDSGGSLRTIVDELGDPRVRYLAHRPARGLAGNHAAAIEAARGEHLAFLHDDDLWLPNHLSSAAQVLEQEPSTGLVLSAVDEVDEDGAVLRRRPTTLAVGVQDDALAQFLHDDVMLMLPSASVFRRTALEGNQRPWPDVPAGDVTMYADVAAAGWQVHYTGRPRVHYRVHASQVGGDQLVHRDAVVRVWERYAFPGAEHGALLRRRLARDLLARAGEQLKRGEAAAARADVRRARDLDRRAAPARSAVLGLLVRVPALAGTAHRVWRGLRSRRS